MKLSAAAIIVFLALLPLAQAQVLDVSVEPAKVATYSGRAASFTALIRNNGGEEQTVVISMAGDRPWWWQPSQLLVKIPPRSERSLAQSFYPVRAEEGEYSFSFQVRSFEYPDIKDAAPLVVEILSPFSLGAVASAKVGEAVKAEVEIFSLEKKEVDIVFEVLSPEGRLVATATSRETVEGKKTVGKSIPFSLQAPGQYTIRVRAGGKAVEAGFPVGAVSRLEKRQETITTPYYQEHAVYITNRGNVAETVVQEEEFSGGGLSITGTVVSTPQSCREGVCSFNLVIPPGETREIRYRHEFWPRYLVGALAVVLVAVAGIRTTGKYTKPRISKRYRKSRAGTSIFISVKNSVGVAKEAMVRDWVSPLAQVMVEELEGMRPVVRKSDAGTELVWALGSLRSKEHRLISYRIKPMVSANLRMSRARLRYKDKEGQPKIVFSQDVSLR